MSFGANVGVIAHEQPQDLEQVLDPLDLVCLRSQNGHSDANSTRFLRSWNENFWKTFGTVTGK